ncbi:MULTISPECIES: DUF2798 domain-containing protein [Thalassospira]|jgi:hypothetical protein|uniref:DUF2798 domain-containing protein n=2 Tax=Thalassospira TaxID=168934 RepID=A0A367W984_9PROT|nr:MULTISPECIES: DUF2798 domain-containing protein [Thalassospira]MDG4718245.1 DUF2798 domain-containing protein [Thalassospira sp. FZY0004]RCK37998.1 hypothetical protein TH19_08310 [Thalassospira profundimaris]|tara:strand:+ start:47 stop:277 length:231 start_codon:yes stop_codon:yes gene_type:complete
MFPPQMQRMVFSFFMSLWLCFLMTGIVTLINTGVDAGYTSRWAQAFIVAWPIGFTLVMLSAGTVNKITSRLVRQVA